MIKFENTEVMGWEHAIRGMRNPMNSWEKSDSGYCGGRGKRCDTCPYNPGDYEPCYFAQKCKDTLYVVGQKDLDLMKRLRSAGTDHRKFMRMITVYVDITAPLYWWKEFDTYKVGTVANSCSTMHKIAAKEFTLEDFSYEHLNDYCEACNIVFGDHSDYLTSLDILKYMIEVLNYWRRRYVATKDKDYWWQMIQLLPSSYNQKRTVMMNYEVLANIYKSRRNHKLDEWSIGFIDWIKTLPYSELITGPDLSSIPIANEIMSEAKRRVVKSGDLGVVSVPRADAEKFAVDFEEELTKHTKRSLLENMKKGEAL